MEARTTTISDLLRLVIITVMYVGQIGDTLAAQRSKERVPEESKHINLEQVRIESLVRVDDFEELTEAEYEIIAAEHEVFIQAILLRSVLDARIISLIPGITDSEINALLGLSRRVRTKVDWRRLTDVIGVSARTSAYLNFASRYAKSAAIGGNPEAEGVANKIRIHRANQWAGRVILRIERNQKSSTATQRAFVRSLRTTAKISIRNADFTSSITARNDPGEPFQWRPDLGWYGFDHVAGYVRWQPSLYPVEITIGHYSLDYGQGVLWSRPFGQRRDASAPHRSLRRSSGIRGHASASGNSFLTGMAAKIQVQRNTQFVLFLSQRNYDARRLSLICSADCTEPGLLNGSTAGWQLSSSDIHVTDDQVARKNSVRSRIVGALFEQRFSTILVGLSSARTTFDKPFRWQQRSSTERSVHSSNLFWVWTADNITVSGEVAVSNTNISGAVLGAVIRPDKHMHGIVLLKYFDGQRIGLHAGASGFSASLEQQWGLVLGWRFVSRKGWKLSASIEYHTGQDHDRSFPGKRHGVDARVFAEIIPVRRARFRIYLRQKRALRMFSISSSLAPSINYPEIASVEQFSAELLYELSPRFQMRLRTDANAAMMGSSDLGTGFQIYQQFDVHVSSRFSITFRASVFESDNSLNRIYVYEPDVSGKLIAPSTSGSGYNLLVLARAINVSGVQLELKVSTRRYSDTYFDIPDPEGKKEIEYRSQHQVTFQISRVF